MITKKILSTPDEIKAYSDPYRIEIITTMNEIGEPATVKQIADRMGEVPAKVHYHIKKLEKFHILELVKTKEINGIIAKYYEPVAHTFQIQSRGWSQASLDILKTETEKVVHTIFERSKKIFLDKVRRTDLKDKNYNEDELQQNIGSVLSDTDLYLTDAEAKEFNKYLRELKERHEEIKDREDRKKYNFFYSFTEVITDLDTDKNKN